MNAIFNQSNQFVLSLIEYFVLLCCVYKMASSVGINKKRFLLVFASVARPQTGMKIWESIWKAIRATELISQAWLNIDFEMRVFLKRQARAHSSVISPNKIAFPLFTNKRFLRINFKCTKTRRDARR